MKKNLWIWALAALSMAACTSEDVPSQDQVVTENDFESPDGRIVVQLGAENTPAATVSRAPIEGDKVTSLTELGIFAINRKTTIKTAEWNGWPDDIENCLLKNVKAQGANSAAEGQDPVEVDPLDKDVNTGKKITLYDTDATTSGQVYYYPIQGTQNFDFYGYHPRQSGDDNVTLAASGKPSVKITLNGDIDLITGEAEQAPDVNEGEIYVTEHSGSTPPQVGTSGSIIEGYNAKYIRKIKYSNWIIDKWNETLGQGVQQLGGKKPFIPMISFVHRLTKLNFQIITAKEQAGDGNQSEVEGGDREDATKLRVMNVKLINVHPEATLSIERTMPVTYSGRSTENLMAMIEANKDNTSVWTTVGDSIIPQRYSDAANPQYISAGYLMVPPTDEISDYTSYPYRISLTVIAKDATGIPTAQDIVLDLKDQNKNYLQFTKGKSYNIRIALYALQEVNVSAELTDWEQGEDAYIPVE